MHLPHPALPALALFAMVLASSAQLPALEGLEVGSVAPAHRRHGVWNSGKIGGGGYLQHASFSKADPNRIYLASDVGGFYRTDDGGQTWRMLHGALPPGEGSTQIRGILAHPTLPDTFLIAAGSSWDAPRGVYRSDDAGTSFVLTLAARFEGNDGTRGDGFVIAADPSNPERVYAAPIGLGPQRSDDFGRTWQPLGLPGVYARDLVVDRANPLRLWVNAAHRGDQTWEAPGGKQPFRHGLFVTADGGAIWEQLPGDETPIEMVQDPADAALLHGAFRKAPQLRRSRDGGRTWQPYANPDLFPPPGDARADGTYAALTAGPDFVLAGGHGGHFYRLPAGGDTWSKLPDPTVHEGDWYAALTVPVERHFGAALGFLAVSPHDPARWLFTDWYACYVSPDAGATWNLAIDGIELTVFHCVAQDPSNPARVHAGMADIGYFRSDDGGATFPLWGRHAKIGNNIKHLAVCAAQPNRLYAVGPITWQWHANQTFRSDDAGATWVRPAQRGLPNLADDGGARCNTIAVHPRNPDEVVLVVSGTVKPGAGGVYRSVNGGDDWEWIGQGLPAEPLFRKDIWVSGPELAVSADGTRVAMSNDRGRGFAYDPAAKRWTELALPHASHCVAADPQVPGRFYAALKDAGLFRSDDGGRTWRNVYGGVAAVVAVDAATRDRLAVSSGDAIWVSLDAGSTWSQVGEGLPSRHVRNSLCFAGDRLICGTGGSGVFWTELARLAGAPVAKSNDRTFALRPALGGGEPAAGGSVPTVPPSLLANGDMAAGAATPAEWSLSGGAKEGRKLARDTAVFASAPAALRLEVQGTAAVAQQRVAGDPAGKTLEASCRVKLEGTLKPVQFVLHCFDGGWKQVAWKTVAQTAQVGEWVELRGKVALPANASNVMCGLLVDGSGSAWLDDVAVVDAGGAAVAAAVPATAPLPRTVAPDDPRLRYIGRFDRTNPAGPRAAWSASAVQVRFRGRSLNAKLATSGDDRVQVFVDGHDAGTFLLKGRELHRVADGLPAGEHVVTILKRTEPHWGTLTFGGFQMEQHAEVLPVDPAPYLLHAIGDSITAAYGNEAPGKDHHFSSVTQNGAESFAAIAARRFGAEYTCVAWSGRTMWPDNTIGEVYGYALPKEKVTVDYAALRAPDAVVIGLSANDFRGGIPDEAGWTQAYADFIARVRREHAPDAQVYLIPSVLMYEKDKLEAFRRYIDRILAIRAEAGDAKVAYLHLPVQDIGADGLGADWHPSVKTHRRNAERLAAALEQDLGWKRLP